MIPFISRLSLSSIRPLLPYAAAGLLVAAGLGYVWSLQSQNQALQSQLGRKTQEVAALEESLRVVNEYEAASGAMRSLWASANEPSADTLTAPDSAQGDVSRRVEAVVETREDTVSGRSKAPRENGRYVHDIGGNRHEGRIWVRPPGDRLRYRIRLLPRRERVSLVQTVDQSGVGRTYVDLPARLSLESVSAQSGRPARPLPASKSRWTSGWSVGAGTIARPSGLYGEARAALSGGIRLGGGLRLSAEVAAGAESRIGGGPVRPISEVSLFLRW
jgi:hypothetical protein